MHEVKKVWKYDVAVHQNEFMDGLRAEECLCLHCVDMPNCSTAKALYGFCVQYNLALAVTRCPDYRVRS